MAAFEKLRRDREYCDEAAKTGPKNMVLAQWLSCTNLAHEAMFANLEDRNMLKVSFTFD